MKRVTRQFFGALFGAFIVALGTSLQFGTPIGLIVFGASVTVAFVLLYDPDERKASP